ncbi:MAG: ABC transporter permease [Caldilineaceae bacterium]
MFYDFKMAWRNIANRPVQTLITILVVGLAIALSVSLMYLNDGLQQGIIRASDPFGVLVVGAKGSAQQLVLSTLLLQGNPIGNIPRHLYEALTTDPRVALAVPLAMGDNVDNVRIIGTNGSFFALGPSLREPPSFQLANGRLFTDKFEAVLGSKAAAQLGLAIGDQFLPTHGVNQELAAAAHEHPQTVVGTLQPSNTPFDNAVFTTLESVVALHATYDPEREAQAEETDQSDEAQITAILVRPVGVVEQNQLWQELYTSTEAQAAFPGRKLGELFDLLNQGQELLRMVGYIATVMAALTLFLAIYSAAGTRERLLAIMRGLGANRNLIFRIVLWETILVACLGAVVGRLAGYAVAIAIAGQITTQSAIPISIRYLPQLEGWLVGLPIVLGIAAGLIPAAMAYRANVVEKLFPA